jgi:hypothetical protein
VKVVLEDLEGIGRQRQDALLAAFAENTEACVGRRQILQLELEDFARA